MLRYANWFLVLIVVVLKQYFVILLAENDDVFPQSFLKSLKK